MSRLHSWTREPVRKNILFAQKMPQVVTFHVKQYTFESIFLYKAIVYAVSFIKTIINDF